MAVAVHIITYVCVCIWAIEAQDADWQRGMSD